MKPWGGRFEKDTDKMVEQFTASLPFDRRLYRQDIAGSVAHVNMLAKVGVLKAEEAGKIKEGLGEVFRQIKSGKFDYRTADEDIHMAVERALIEIVGPVGGKLHTARSRNDQVALDVRMYVREEIIEISKLVARFQSVIVELAAKHLGDVMPGYSHLQRAQPILVSHHLMAYFWMLGRDFERLEHAFAAADVMPLGSAALAGTSFPIDREFVAKQLGFSRITDNSVDAVSDRDFAVDFITSAATIMTHLSRMAEEIVIWCTQEFGYLELDDAFATGSSIMPQKKNADVAELVRAKTGRVFGDLVQLLTLQKGLPLAYGKDLQEDKEAIFDAADTAKGSLDVMRAMVETLTINTERMRAAADESFTTATDLADYLAAKGLPFREAHAVAGKIVKFGIENNLTLQHLTIEQLKGFSRLFEEEALDVVKTKHSVDRRTSAGGTATPQVEIQIKAAKQALSAEAAWVDKKVKESIKGR